MVLAFAFLACLFAVVYGAVWLFSRAEYDGPAEPWLDWDGTEPAPEDFE
jgi:hypothetical protein